MDKRSFGEISTISPKRLKMAIQDRGSRKYSEMLRIDEDIIKAARIPIPPPFGIGIGISWELRSFGISSNPRRLPCLATSQAPIPPKAIEDM